MSLRGGVNQHPENGNIFQADPATLMRDNPAAEIFNKESYARMAGRFSYGPNGQFESPQIVRVTTFSSAHEEAIKIFVLDGMTRTKFVYDHRHNRAVIPLDFQFTVKDVTSSVLQNPAYISEEEKADGQQALTMLQYLRAVIPPTIEHAQIAPSRIATHIINAWENRVGPDLARRFSALAALSFLANPEVPTATDKLLDDFLKRQDALVAGEMTPERIQERVELQLTLREFATILRQTKLPKKDVERSAYMLVSTASPIIGGEIEARKQVYGLLHSPSVEAKLANAFPDHIQREEMRIQLGREIMKAFAQLSRSPNREKFNDDIGSALANSHISFAQLENIIKANDPSRMYEQVKQSNNRDRLQRYYQTVERRQELTEIEARFIDRFGKVTVLQDADLPRITNHIKSIDNALQQAASLKAQLTQDRDGMIKKGVRPDTIDEAIAAINSSSQQLLEVSAVHNIQRKINELGETKAEIGRKISRQMAVYEAGKIVAEVYGDSLKSPSDASLRRDIGSYILREFDIADKAAIRTRLSQLKGLDADLQSQVIGTSSEGRIRINKALQIHQERRKRPAKPKAVEEKPVSVVPPVSKPIDTKPSVTTPPPEPQGQEDQIVEDRRQAEKIRIAFNDNKLRQGTQSYLLDTLMNLDLDQQDLTTATKRVVDNMLQTAGKIRFTHPDLVRFIEDSFRKDEDILRLREVIVNLEQEIASRDTRTDR